MKVTKLTTYRLPPRWMFLKIETDEGVTGWGEPVIEGRARSVETAVNELSEYVVGQDPARINDIWQAMYRTGFYRGGPILMSAIAGIDQALWDIKGKVLGAPVYELLGGQVRERMKMYSWVGGDRPADVIAGIRKLQAIGFLGVLRHRPGAGLPVDHARQQPAGQELAVGRPLDEGRPEAVVAAR